MDYANVIPIDADVARLLERRRTKFRWLVFAVALVWMAVLVPTILFTPLPPLGSFTVFAVLVVLAEHRFVVFGDETSMSASIIVVIASVFVFADSSPFAGPLLIASLGGLFFPLLRSRAFAKATFNVSAFGLSAVSAVCVSLLLGPIPPTSTLGALFAASLASVVYWYVNSALTGSASALRLESRLSASVRAQATSEWPTLFLTVAAGLGGFTFDQHVSIAALGVVFLVLVFELRVHRTPDHHRSAHQWGIHATSAVLGLCATIWHTSPFGAMVALSAIFVVSSEGGSLPERAARTATIAVLITPISLALETAGLGGAPQFVLCTLLSLSAFTALLFRNARWVEVRRRWLLGLGYWMPSASEAAIVGGIAACLMLVQRPASTHAITLIVLACMLGLGRPWRRKGFTTVIDARPRLSPNEIR